MKEVVLYSDDGKCKTSRDKHSEGEDLNQDAENCIVCRSRYEANGSKSDHACPSEQRIRFPREMAHAFWLTLVGYVVLRPEEPI